MFHARHPWFYDVSLSSNNRNTITCCDQAAFKRNVSRETPCVTTELLCYDLDNIDLYLLRQAPQTFHYVYIYIYIYMCIVNICEHICVYIYICHYSLSLSIYIYIYIYIYDCGKLLKQLASGERLWLCIRPLLCGTPAAGCQIAASQTTQLHLEVSLPLNVASSLVERERKKDLSLSLYIYMHTYRYINYSYWYSYSYTYTYTYTVHNETIYIYIHMYVCVNIYIYIYSCM